MQVNADSLGSYLRRERELREVSLQNMSAATKIQLRFLEALEQDNYDQLPPAPFVVGFLRAYAQYLSLEPEEVIAAYHMRYGPSEGPEGRRVLVTSPVQRATRYRLLRAGILVVIAVLVVGLGLHVLQRGSGNNRTKALLSQAAVEKAPAESPPMSLPRLPGLGMPRPQSAEPVSPVSPGGTGGASGVVPGQQAIASASPAASPSAPAEPAAAERPTETAVRPGETPSPLVLQAVAVQDTWLRVEVDGDKRYTLLLATGKDVRWEARERFVLTVGNAQGTRLTLNGKEIPLPSTRGNVIRDFVLTHALLN